MQRREWMWRKQKLQKALTVPRFNDLCREFYLFGKKVCSVVFRGVSRELVHLCVLVDYLLLNPLFVWQYWYLAVSSFPTLQQTNKHSDSLSRYGSCTNTPGCKFWLTTNSCFDDNDDTSSFTDCYEWAIDAQSCLPLVQCSLYIACTTCASQQKG